MINIDNKELNVESNGKVVCNKQLTMFFMGGYEEKLNVKIEADFSKLKPEHHQLFLQYFNSEYNRKENKVIEKKIIEKKSFFKRMKNLLNGRKR